MKYLIGRLTIIVKQKAIIINNSRLILHPKWLHMQPSVIINHKQGGQVREPGVSTASGEPRVEAKQKDEMAESKENKNIKAKTQE